MLKSEKGLLWLPVLSFLGSVVVVGVFGLAVWATLGKDTGLDGQNEYSTNVATYVLGVCTYIGVAFVADLLPRRARAPARTSGCRVATRRSAARSRSRNSRLHRILPWAIVSATVSMIIQAIEERFGFLGQIIAGLIGAAWNVVTFLTVPIIVFEDVGPVNALKRSGTLLKQTWGENLMAQIGLGLIGLARVHPRRSSSSRSASRAASASSPCSLIAHRCGVPRDRRVRSSRALSGIYRTALVPLRGRRSGAAGVREHRHGARVRRPQGHAAASAAVRRFSSDRAQASRQRPRPRLRARPGCRASPLPTSPEAT